MIISIPPHVDRQLRERAENTMYAGMSAAIVYRMLLEAWTEGYIARQHHLEAEMTHQDIL